MSQVAHIRPTVAEALSRADAAHARADAAHDRLDGHERLCTERHIQIAKAIGEVKEEIKGQRALLWGIILSVCSASVAMLVVIIVHAVKLT